MNFCSDNTAGAHPTILAALAAANDGAAMPYGNDDLTRKVETRIREIFERDCAVFLVGTGTAANALALACLTPPWGTVYCHPDSHVNRDECGAPEFYAGGAKLIAVAGDDGKFSAERLAATIMPGDVGVAHHAQPAAVSLTQATEAGTVYTPAEIRAIADVAHRNGLAVHMDGARFANALVSLGRSPAELTWRAGVDVLSFGATKNGAVAAEAVVFFDKAKAAEMPFRRKRGGQLWSKMRFLAAQFDAYLGQDLWLMNARFANSQARRLGQGLAKLPGARIAYPVEANEVFVTLPEAVILGLEADGFRFYRWPDDTATMLRLVTSFNTAPEHVDAFLASAARHMHQAGRASG
ncbi:MAG: low specificity L-threonine aldolase [Alphaproteobacteria bacterium]|nr:low specificity L-threonine aldolase [Alphaproteobacteria bacterium]